ncbi:MAG TPA: diacylglycerol kinase family protein [Rubrobacteraceae bacterium]|nr:diacylglycerol kinase family protein [Rubrobacteraceae bacterium]
MEGSKMRARVICNPSSGGGKCEPDTVREALGGLEIEWIDTEGAGDAQEAAGGWERGLLIVVGGDGTVNEVVNGLGRAGFPEEVTLAILPMGTGNDLAATLAIPDGIEEAQEVIRQNRVRVLDVARVRSEGVGERFFINVATGGYGAETSGLADEELKGRWGKLAYLRASLETAQRFEVRDVRVILDDEERTMRAVNVAVGNCRYAGGGWLAAPRANPEDGLLDLVVIEDIGLKEALALAPAALARSDYLGAEGVFSARAKKIQVQTEPGGLDFTADGEVIGDEPVEFEIIPHVLNVIVGPDYVAEPYG